jgi:hypothetical protein
VTAVLSNMLQEIQALVQSLQGASGVQPGPAGGGPILAPPPGAPPAPPAGAPGPKSPQDQAALAQLNAALGFGYSQATAGAPGIAATPVQSPTQSGPAGIPPSVDSAARNQQALTVLNNALARGYNVPVPSGPSQVPLDPGFKANPSHAQLDRVLGVPALTAAQDVAGGYVPIPGAPAQAQNAATASLNQAALSRLNNALGLGYSVAYPGPGTVISTSKALDTLHAFVAVRDERLSDIIREAIQYQKQTGERDVDVENKIVAIGQTNKSFTDDVAAITAAAGRLTPAQASQLANAAGTMGITGDPTAFHNLKVQLLGA